jgi:RNA polymerase sigma-70 factor (ECF subfamily)
MTVNRSIDYLRKRGRKKFIPFESVSDESVFKDRTHSPDRKLEMDELKGAIQSISKELTFNQRKVFVLRDLQGFSAEEIAQILDCRVSTVRVHLSKARNHIKRALLDQGIHIQSGEINPQEK